MRVILWLSEMQEEMPGFINVSQNDIQIMHLEIKLKKKKTVIALNNKNMDSIFFRLFDIYVDVRNYVTMMFLHIVVSFL